MPQSPAVPAKLFNERIFTQLGGKFSAKENGLFDLKKNLINAGIDVRYPEGNAVIASLGGIELTFHPTKSKTFIDVEKAFLECISHSHGHIVHNKFMDNIGYIGESTSIEISFALSHQKPIILLYPISYSETVPIKVKQIIDNNSNRFSILRLDLLRGKELHGAVASCFSKTVAYDLKIAERDTIQQYLDQLLERYKVALT